jgi:hypothetical protein
LETEIAGREDTVRRSRLALLAARREDTNAGFVLIVDGVTHHHAVDTAAIPRTNGFGCAADAAAFAGPWGGGGAGVVIMTRKSERQRTRNGGA